MITPEDVVKVWASPERFAEISRYARDAEIGGVSRIRGKEERAEFLAQDQVVGMLGQWALAVHLNGHDLAFRTQRQMANAYKTRGDGGVDIPGTNLDIKTSLMRRSKDPLEYRLLLAPRERHPGTVYILGLVPTLEGAATNGVDVLIVGWAAEHQIPREFPKRGPVIDAYCVPARELNPVIPIRWEGVA